MAFDFQNERRRAHALLDRLPPSKLGAVRTLMEVMVDEDDEELTEEDRAAIQAGLDSLDKRGGIPHEEILAEFGLTMAKRSQQFQEAANDLRTKPAQNTQGQAVAAAPRAKVAQVDHAAAVSVPEKRASYDNTVANAETNSKAAFNLDSNTNLSWLLFNGIDG